VIGFDVKSDGADELLASPRCNGEYVIVLFATVLVRRNPALRLAVGIWIRNPQCVESDLARIDQALHVGRISKDKGPQHEPFRPQHESDSKL